eukprot:jgi/Mesen1/7877/ME000420S07031
MTSEEKLKLTLVRLPMDQAATPFGSCRLQAIRLRLALQKTACYIPSATNQLKEKLSQKLQRSCLRNTEKLYAKSQGRARVASLVTGTGSTNTVLSCPFSPEVSHFLELRYMRCTHAAALDY